MNYETYRILWYAKNEKWYKNLIGATKNEIEENCGLCYDEYVRTGKWNI